MTKLINTYLSGIGIGSIFYLGALYYAGMPDQSFQNIASCLLISGFMGLSGFIYELKHLTFISKLFLHFGAIFSLAVTMNLYNNWLSINELLGFFLQFLIIYVIIWLGVWFLNTQASHKINQKLAENRK